ncbi:MAG: DUF1178 family protein [Alphaproteobacteria bacterium]|jgi:hypothetical protein|nr:DUF1178 family protein [Alphaproteobacteria bacterium]MBT5859906.1 DUF1178 family protein [Alphaproteobacteria bacterium]
MILYDVRCGNDHVFEGWFPGSDGFDTQAKAGQVACPLCGDTAVERAPMAPNVSTGGAQGNDPRKASMAEATQMLTNVRELVENHCDDVGSDFAEEARKMHYGEKDRRSIYGEATVDEAVELADEGIEFGELPRLPRRNS